MHNCLQNWHFDSDSLSHNCSMAIWAGAKFL